MPTTASILRPPRSHGFVAGELAALRVVVADDHDLYRRVVSRAIDRHPGLEVAGQAANGADAVSLVAALAPDVALLDLRMPGLDGLGACERIRAFDPDVAVVILTAFDDDDTPAQAWLAGASACLGKDATEEEICAALLRAGDGTGADAPAAA